MFTKVILVGTICFLPLAILGLQVTTMWPGRDFNNIGFDDVIFSDDVIFDSVVRSKLECSIRCSTVRCCVTFTLYVTPTTSGWSCRGYSSYMTSGQSTSAAPGAMTFSRRKPDELPRSCAEAKILGLECSDILTINAGPTLPSLQVVCQEDWTVILRRQNSSVDFYRDWTDYEDGFGDLTGAFWLGLEAIHQLTSNTPQDLRVELADWNDTMATADYRGFSVESAAQNYSLSIHSFEGGTAGDSLTYHNATSFSTKDSDNDVSRGNCAIRYGGAWWYRGCHYANLCGVYQQYGPAQFGQGVQWHSWKTHYYSMKFAQMMIRPSQ